MDNDIIFKLKEKLNNSKAPLRIKVKVIANAKVNSLEKIDEDTLKIKINKPALDGRANKAIIEYLSDIFCVPKSNVVILKGLKSSLKDLIISPKSPII